MSSPHRFVVRRQVYTPPDAAGVRRLLPEKHERVATFPKADAAFTDCAKRLAEFRRTTNPFQLGGPCLFYQTNLPAFAFHDYLLDHNITPPPTSLTANPNYVFWWVKHNRTFTDREREVIWTACDKLRPFDVIEEDDRKAVYVVGELPWYDHFEIRYFPDVSDESWVCPEEGCLWKSAHLSSRSARRACKELERDFRRDLDRELREAQVEMAEHAVYRMNAARAGGGETAFDFLSHPRTEFVAVPYSGDGSAHAVRIVARKSYVDARGGYLTGVAGGCTYVWDTRVPLAVFDGEAGEHDRAMRLSRAKRTVNPFALAWPAEAINIAHLADPDGVYDHLLPNNLSYDDAIEIIRKLPTIPPAPEVLTADWYDRVVQWSPEFVDVIWSTFADFRLFEVIEVPLG